MFFVVASLFFYTRDACFGVNIGGLVKMEMQRVRREMWASVICSYTPPDTTLVTHT